MPDTMEFAYMLRPPRPTFPSDATEVERNLIGEHFEYLKRLRDEGVVVFAGRAEDASFGIVVYRAPDEHAARRLMQDDPAVRGGVFGAQIHTFRIALVGK
jgi:uncharacterized protein YciI